ncbi:Na+/H+ antiporter subunit E [Halorubellus salinus]|uniref:Na+/H+ antiporter subunit E n=1 Tax=Halorubellus salinus TaxID=755309 RepID=UPI0034A57776
MSDDALDDADAPTEPANAAPREDLSDDAPRRWPLLGFAFAVLWLFVRGVDIAEGGELVLGLALGEFLIGLTVGIPIAFLFRRFFSPTPVLVRTPRALLAALQYATVFLWELLTANVDVAYRVLSPSMPIDPDVIEVPLRVETDLAITTIANSITLTPGTLTMDYDAERNSLYVHAIAADDPSSIVDPIRTWEDLALVIFDERRDPGSPVPEPVGDASVEHEGVGASSADLDERDEDVGGEGDA